jgi:hypothetical protein
VHLFTMTISRLSEWTIGELTFGPLCIRVAGWCSGNAVDTYSGGSPFEPLPALAILTEVLRGFPHSFKVYRTSIRSLPLPSKSFQINQSFTHSPPDSLVPGNVTKKPTNQEASLNKVRNNRVYNSIVSSVHLKEK